MVRFCTVLLPPRTTMSRPSGLLAGATTCIKCCSVVLSQAFSLVYVIPCSVIEGAQLQNTVAGANHHIQLVDCLIGPVIFAQAVEPGSGQNTSERDSRLHHRHCGVGHISRSSHSTQSDFFLVEGSRTQRVSYPSKPVLNWRQHLGSGNSFPTYACMWQ